MTKQDQLLASLLAGKTLSTTQIATTFKLKDPHSAIRALRQAGHCIYSTQSGKSNKFHLGSPSRMMVTIASMTFGTHAFSQ